MKRKLIWLSAEHTSPFNRQSYKQFIACANGEQFKVSKGEHESQWRSEDDTIKYDQLEEALSSCQIRSDIKSSELDPSESQWLVPAQIEAELQQMEVQWGPVSRSNANLCDGGVWSYSCAEYAWVGERANDVVDHVCERSRDLVRDRVRRILLGSRFRIELDEKWCNSIEELEKHVVAFEHKWNVRSGDECEHLNDDKSDLYDLASPVDLPFVMERVEVVIKRMYLR